MSTEPAHMEDVFSEEGNAASTNNLGRAVFDLVAAHDDIVVLSADLGTNVPEIRETYPERYFEMGIAETNAISVAAGFAASGYRPYVLAFAPFGMLKCAEQIRTDWAATMLPARFITRLSGLAMGYFGPSHHAIEDIAIARSITNLTVTTSADNNATIGLLRATYDTDGPVLIRVSEGASEVYAEPPTFVPGKFHQLRDGSDITIIATGVGVGLAVQAAETLAADGIEATVYDAAYIKPLDVDAIVATVEKTSAILTVEEHLDVGGLSTAVAETLGRRGLVTKFGSLALPDEDLEVGTPAALLEHYGLTPAGVVQRAKELLGR